MRGSPTRGVPWKALELWSIILYLIFLSVSVVTIISNDDIANVIIMIFLFDSDLIFEMTEHRIVNCRILLEIDDANVHVYFSFNSITAGVKLIHGALF